MRKPIIHCATCGAARTHPKRGSPNCKSCSAKKRVREQPNARFRAMPDAWKARARLLKARGYGVADIVGHLADEGMRVAGPTVYGWVTNQERAT